MNDSFRRVMAALVLFGISFGFVEAAVVVYLRAMLAPVRRQVYPTVPEKDVFPIIKIEQLGPELTAILKVELLRELATLVMMSAVGLLVSRKWLAGYAVAFGVWDISFYGFLKILIDWPESLFTWDLLFLLPVPWYGPVIAPMIVAATMIWLGASYLRQPFEVRKDFVLGPALLVIAFCWDWRNLLAGGLPNPFPWWLFALGEAMLLLSCKGWSLFQTGSRGPARAE